MNAPAMWPQAMPLSPKISSTTTLGQGCSYMFSNISVCYIYIYYLYINDGLNTFHAERCATYEVGPYRVAVLLRPCDAYIQTYKIHTHMHLDTYGLVHVDMHPPS